MDIRHANEAERLAQISTSEPSPVRAAVGEDLIDEAREHVIRENRRQGRYNATEAPVRETASPAGEWEGDDEVHYVDLKAQQKVPHDAKLPEFETPDEDRAKDADSGDAKPGKDVKVKDSGKGSDTAKTAKA